MTQESYEDYQGFILNTEADIERFLNVFGLTPAQTNRLIGMNSVSAGTREQQAIDKFIANMTEDFPSSFNMSKAARSIQRNTQDDSKISISDPDSTLLRWLSQEYILFKAIEYSRYGDIITQGFSSVDDFIIMANKVLNRRKSRAGKSLEHHLAAKTTCKDR